nr:mannose-6-phosphate isomerase 1-like [Tanacetum cinerariifolium]
MDSQVNASKREGTTERVIHDNLRAPLQQLQEDAAKVGKNNFDSSRLLSGSVTFDGQELLRSETTHRNKMMGKRDVNANAYQSTPSTKHDIIFKLFAFKVENHDNSIPSKASPSDPMVQPVDINTKSTSYARAVSASTKESPSVISNFHPLLADPVFDGVNISIPCKVFKKVLMHTLSYQDTMSDGVAIFAPEGMEVYVTTGSKLHFYRAGVDTKTPLALPWERIPRLDSGVRIRICSGE